MPKPKPQAIPAEIDYCDEPSLYFVVEGQPIPKERPRLGRRKTYTPKNTKDYKDLVQDTLLLAMQNKVMVSKDIPISLNIEFRRKNQVKADVDNLAKAVMDACNGVLWEDDKQVRRLFVDVSYGWGSRACAVVRLYLGRTLKLS